MYSASSLVRTIEMILGLKPLTQFDATATPMIHAFQATPDTRPYEALAPTQISTSTTAFSASAARGRGRWISARKTPRRIRAKRSHLAFITTIQSDATPIHAAFVFEHPKSKAREGR